MKSSPKFHKTVGKLDIKISCHFYDLRHFDNWFSSSSPFQPLDVKLAVRDKFEVEFSIYEEELFLRVVAEKEANNWYIFHLR